MQDRYLLDTNVIIYSLKSGLELPEAIYCTTEINKKEVLSFYKMTEEEKAVILELFSKINILGINETIKQHAQEIEQKYSIPGVDAIICATALFYNLTLITNDQLLHQVKEIKAESFYFVN
jgi:predicted nucleic acid-binding protein